MKLSTALNKLEKLNITPTKESFGPTDFYYFSVNGAKYEFNIQPTGDNQVSGFCRTFDNGESPSFYNSFNHMMKFVSGLK
jgi:hypothetical protein